MIYFILGVSARGDPGYLVKLLVGAGQNRLPLLLGSYCCRFPLEVYNSRSSAQLSIVALLLFFLHSLIPLYC